MKPFNRFWSTCLLLMALIASAGETSARTQPAPASQATPQGRIAAFAAAAPVAATPAQPAAMLREGQTAAGAVPIATAFATSPVTPDEEEAPLNPFPARATESMTATIEAILAEYTHAIAAQQGQLVGPVAVPNSGAVVYLPVIATRPVTPPTPVPTPKPRPHGADVAVTIWPNPSIIVARGSTLAYEVRVRNYGRGAADGVHIRLPYTRQQMVPAGSYFTGPEDWISEVGDDHLTISFGDLQRDAYRTATIYFKVGSMLPDDTVISMRASYEWDDARDGGSWTSNWAPVLVGSGNQSAPWVWLAVFPAAGTPGTLFHFYTDRFIPREGIYVWLNTPSGARPVELYGFADPLGRVCLDYGSGGLSPGTYSLALYGARSNLVAIATFYVYRW